MNRDRFGWSSDDLCSICLYLCSSLFLLVASVAHATDVTVTARVDPPSVTIGTPFRYVVEIDAPKDTSLVIPLLGERFGDFTVTDFGDEPAKETNGQVKVVRWFALVGYAAGDHTLPAYPVEYGPADGERQKVEGNTVTVIVESLLPKEPTPLDIRDIAEPEALPFDWRPALIGAAAALLLVALAGAVYYLAHRRRARSVVPVPEPHEVALEALRNLRDRHLLEAGLYEEYWVTLSAIVRRYVEGRFGLHAPEMTTEEFLAIMQRDRRLAGEHRALLGEFLAESDLVKFARHTPTVEDGERGFGAAKRFVDESKAASPAIPGAPSETPATVARDDHASA